MYKKIEYLREKKSKELIKSGKKDYMTVSGITIKIGNLDAFAAVIESIFVNQDYPAKQVGEFSNFNMRKALGLAKRVITSAVIHLEDLVKSYITGEMVAPNPAAFANALIKGDYDFYKPGDEPLLFPIFQIDHAIVQSPLLNLRVLTLLSDLARVASEDDQRYMTVNSILAYFGTMAVPEVSTQRSLEALLAAGLLEPYDLSKKNYSDDQRLAITYSGRSHLSFGLFNPVYFEQMALTTRIPDTDIAAQIRGAALLNLPVWAKYEQVREIFAGYICDEDRRQVNVPERPEFQSQSNLREDIRKRWVAIKDNSEDRWRLPDVVAEAVEGRVDFYDKYRGFGFVDISELNDRVFLHARVLEQSDFVEVFDGDTIVCDINRNEKGLAVSKVHHVNTETGTMADGYIVKRFADRKYGFIHIPDLKIDAMFHDSVLALDMRNVIKEGDEVTVALKFDEQGRAQVRTLTLMT